MDKQENEKDKNNQESGSDSSSNENKEIIDPLEEKMVQKLQDLELQRLRRAIKKPHIEAKFQALKYRPVQFYTLSDEEKNRIFLRRLQRIELEVLPDPPLPPIFFRPPKHPKPPINLLPPKPSTLPRKKRKIPENWAKNPNKGIVIEGEGSEFTSKRRKNEDQDQDQGHEEEDQDREEDEGGEENMNGYTAAVHKPVYRPIKKLFEMTKTLVKRKGIQSLEGKIYAVLHKGVNKVLKNYDKEAKRSFYEWVKDCKDLERFNSIKRRAVNPGMSMSRVIVDTMFLMSENKANEMEAKFQAFEDALSWVDRDQNTVVISRLLDLIKAAETQLRLKNDREMAASKGKEIMAAQEDDLEESFIDTIMHNLLHEIFLLELFWVYRRLPCSRWALIEEFPLLETEVSRFELQLMALEFEIHDSVEDAKFGVVDLDWRETNDYVNMDIKMDELWHDLEE